jgi:hypothetical protein
MDDGIVYHFDDVTDFYAGKIFTILIRYNAELGSRPLGPIPALGNQSWCKAPWNVLLQ